MSNIMLDKTKDDASAPETSDTVDQLTASLECKATPANSFALPLAVPAYEGHTDKKSIADFLQKEYLRGRSLPPFDVLAKAAIDIQATILAELTYQPPPPPKCTLAHVQDLCMTCVEVGAVTRTSAQADHVMAAGKGPDLVMVSTCQSPANIVLPNEVLSLYANLRTPTAASPCATFSLQEQPPGAPQSLRCPALVGTSSNRQEAELWETSDKATYAEREKVGFHPTRTPTRVTSKQRSCTLLWETQCSTMGEH
ncbi:hypothetical protein HPB51_028187 [Rhipicephalus microplus]|uniref:Uncharacterized protein n=1 Tax=Rhipicephalus microplus TaxID=6941 RepID=A0A9J6CXZ2_RHIMP|nr:hypothetical protein HPB51_028187 [Rhipicephalus microplus]